VSEKEQAEMLFCSCGDGFTEAQKLWDHLQMVPHSTRPPPAPDRVRELEAGLEDAGAALESIQGWALQFSTSWAQKAATLFPYNQLRAALINIKAALGLIPRAAPPAPEPAAKPEPVAKRDGVHWLECDHCGEAAIESVDGLYTDGDGGTCMTCGFPGQVYVDEADGAYWAVHEGGETPAVCRRPDCDDCRPDRKPAEPAAKGPAGETSRSTNQGGADAREHDAVPGPHGRAEGEDGRGPGRVHRLDEDARSAAEEPLPVARPHFAGGECDVGEQGDHAGQRRDTARGGQGRVDPASAWVDYGRALTGAPTPAVGQAGAGGPPAQLSEAEVEALRAIVSYFAAEEVDTEPAFRGMAFNRARSRARAAVAAREGGK